MNEEPEVRTGYEAAPAKPQGIRALIALNDQTGRARTIGGWFIGWRGQEADENLTAEGIVALDQHSFIPTPGSVDVEFVEPSGNRKVLKGKISDLGGWTNARVVFESPINVQEVADFVSQQTGARSAVVKGRHLLLGTVVAEARIESRAAKALVQEWAKRHAPTDQIEEISTLASVVIGDPQRALRWLSEPNLAIDNRAPIDLIGEKDGCERVKNLLLRAEFGVLA